MPKIWFDEEIAATYDVDSADRFDPDLLATTTEVLAGLAGDGRALELAVGTGRAGATGIEAVEGDMTTTRVDGSSRWPIWSTTRVGVGEAGLRFSPFGGGTSAGDGRRRWGLPPEPPSSGLPPLGAGPGVVRARRRPRSRRRAAS